MMSHEALSDFHPVVRRWFEQTYAIPSPPQALGWPSIASGRHTLILAPTGSGKTLTAFLWAINHLVEQKLRDDLRPGVRILYVSPLKALNNDIHRNLEEPLAGIQREAEAGGVHLKPIRMAVRTGDTPAAKRASIVSSPPDILITTPESLYLMLTSQQARKVFTTVQYVIVDEIHALCANKRGVHLAVSLERLQELADQEFIRIGLSATQRPLDAIAAFLGGSSWKGTGSNRTLEPRPVAVIDAGGKKTMDLRVECPVPDFSLVAAEGVWPAVFVELLELMKAHRTTLVFVNNRRLAERVAAKLNEMLRGDDNNGTAAGRGFNLYAVPHRTSAPPSAEPPDDVDEDPVRAYHGSMSREAREEMEADLKAGRLRTLIATSALELGIDIGSVDLVIQLQSPHGIARGLQRVGRSGHLIHATSKGRIFPTFREDLVEAAVVARSMLGHDVEITSIPRNCLDVLAQQIVAMVSVDEWEVGRLYDVIRQAMCYQNLPRDLFDAVLRMLTGRYEGESFRELRARISWDRVNDVLRPLPGSARLAIMSGGTIADRGAFGVYLADGKTRVGEVDEEFVFETRVGDAFILGTSVWRVTAMDDQRLTVDPAPGEPARMPFWRGEGIGRTFELGAAVGAFRRAMSERIESPDCLAWLQQEFPMDRRAAWNIEEYFRRQQEVCGVIPHDRLLLVEGFRDEIGDPRIIVHSSYGRRINGLLGLVLAHRLHEMVGVEPQMLYNDAGILLRCTDAESLPLDLFDGLTAATARELAIQELLTSPLFGGQFRQNASRALLMPKTAPGKRTPLWLQRLRARDLLQIARQHDDFPIVIETVREVLNDILDIDHFVQLMREIESGGIVITTARTEVPSPFAASLLFDFIAVYMYEWDQPRADKLSSYLSVNRELLAQIVDPGTIASMLRPEAIADVEQRLQHTADHSRARSPEELMEILLRLGDLSEAEILERCEGNGREMLARLEADGRAVQMVIAGALRWVAGEEQEIYADLMSEDHARLAIQRYLQNHGPVTTARLARRYGIDRERVRSIAGSLPPSSNVVPGTFGGDDAQEDPGQWVFRPNLEKIHRRTITILRKEITPCSLPDLSRFLLSWQHVTPSAGLDGPGGVQTILELFQGYASPPDVWERDILPRRVTGYNAAWAGQASGGGGIVWIGRGPGRIMPAIRGDVAVFLARTPDETAAPPDEPASRILAALRQQGASYISDLRAATGLSLGALNQGLAELFWHGLITNDLYIEILALKASPKPTEGQSLEPLQMTHRLKTPARMRTMAVARRAIRQTPGWSGRWSLLEGPGILGDTLPMEEIAVVQVQVLLARYGVLAREFHRREELLPWGVLAGELQRLELHGKVRRGYFIEGLSGMQYALPEAVEELRRLRNERSRETDVVLLNALDPAALYGSGLPFPPTLQVSGEMRFARVAGNFIAIRNGTPVLFAESAGGRLWTVGDPNVPVDADAVRSLVTALLARETGKKSRTVIIEYVNGGRPAGSHHEPVLRSLGFSREMNQTMRYDQWA